jgi:hypothetical protein
MARQFPAAAPHPHYPSSLSLTSVKGVLRKEAGNEAQAFCSRISSYIRFRDIARPSRRRVLESLTSRGAPTRGSKTDFPA